MFKKSLGFIAGLAVALTVFAAGAQLRPDHPDTYVVKKGDTLWDISARFLNKPWLWPEIWRANPQIHNPHLIYPGDVLSLAYLGGRSYLKLEPSVHASELPIPTIPLKDIKSFLKQYDVMSADEVKSLPYVVGLEENRLRAAPGQFLYVRGGNAQPGQVFAVVRPTHAYREFHAGKENSQEVGHLLDNNVAMVAGPWQEITRGDGHWGKGKSLGVEVEVIGTARVQKAGDPASYLLTDATRAIRAGDRLMPVDPHPYDATYYPHAATSLPDDANVIALAQSQYAEGKTQVVALSVGAADGVNNGTTFSIYQPGARIHDDVISSSRHRAFGPKVTLPSEFVGHVMVFRTFDHVSYALIMDAIRPVKIGDDLALPE